MSNGTETTDSSTAAPLAAPAVATTATPDDWSPLEEENDDPIVFNFFIVGIVLTLIGVAVHLVISRRRHNRSNAS